jgi:glycosyltransferase involved in cell wall biosynthesis
MKSYTLDIKMLSVVMPCYKSESFITSSLERLVAVLDKTNYKYEVICVIDGTKVDNAYKKAEHFASQSKGKVKVYGYPQNGGKGYAVRYGMARAKGNVIGYFDVGNEINPEGIPLLLEHMKWYGADAVFGSKRHVASKVNYPWQRRIISFTYQLLVKFLFGVKISDTQVGMKFFRKELVDKVLPRILVKRFALDIEILAVSRYLGFTKIYESPVELNMKFEGGISTITSKGFVKTLLNALIDTLAVFYRLKILDYYNDKNQLNWKTPKYLVSPE